MTSSGSFKTFLTSGVELDLIPIIPKLFIRIGKKLSVLLTIIQ